MTFPTGADKEVDDTIDALLRHFRAGLSEWEHDFVTSLQRQRGRGASLTARQRAKLDDVFERASGGGKRGRAEDQG